MPTPMFKVLAQSLRLGQPPDATTALRVLVEVAEKQQAEIEDLRGKLAIVASRLQYAEARLARVGDRADGEAASESPLPGRAGPPSARRSEAPRAPTHPPMAPPGTASSPALPGAPRAPTFAMASASLVDTGLDDFNQTLVISKLDVDEVAAAEAPFPLAPASERPRAPGPHAAGTPFQRSGDEAPPTSRGPSPSFLDDEPRHDGAVLDVLHDDAFLGEGEVTTRHRRDPGRE